MIRVLEHARVTASMEVEGSPTVLHIYEDEESKTVLFGTTDGKVGILDVERYNTIRFAVAVVPIRVTLLAYKGFNVG